MVEKKIPRIVKLLIEDIRSNFSELNFDDSELLDFAMEDYLADVCQFKNKEIEINEMYNKFSWNKPEKKEKISGPGAYYFG